MSGTWPIPRRCLTRTIGSLSASRREHGQGKRTVDRLRLTPKDGKPQLTEAASAYQPPRFGAHRAAELYTVVHPEDVGVPHAHAAVADRLAEQLRVRGPVDAECPALPVCEADPALAQRVQRTGRNPLDGPSRGDAVVELEKVRMHDHLLDMVLTGGGFPAVLPDRDRERLDGEPVVIIHEVDASLTQPEDQMGRLVLLRTRLAGVRSSLPVRIWLGPSGRLAAAEHQPGEKDRHRKDRTATEQ